MNPHTVKRVSRFTYTTIGADGITYTLTHYQSGEGLDVRLYIPRRGGARKQIQLHDAPEDVRTAFLECPLTAKFCNLACPRHGIRDNSQRHNFYCKLAVAKERATAPQAPQW